MYDLKHNLQPNEQAQTLLLADLEPQLRISRRTDRIFAPELQYVEHFRIAGCRCKPPELFLARGTAGRHDHPADHRALLRRNVDPSGPPHSLHPGGGSIVSALALALMPNCPRLLAFAPLAMGAFILLFMDLSFNVTMQPFRALVADMLDDRQKTQGYVVQTFLINLGAVIGAILPLIMTQLGVSDEAEPGSVPEHIAYSYYIGGAILLLTVLVTSFKTKEYPPEEFARYNDLKPEPEGPRPGFMTLMRNIPQAMVRLGVTQFFSWAALFLMWTYLKPAITGVVTDHATGEILSAGATQTWVGVLNGTYPIPACIAALFLGRIAARWGNRPVYAACLLLGAAGFAGLCLLHNQYALMIPMVGIGIAWAGILAMPYAILSRAVEPRHMGVYMGIFNFTITIPQIVIGLTGGAIVKYCFASNAVWMLALAGLFMLLAALSVGFVREEAAR